MRRREQREKLHALCYVHQQNKWVVRVARVREKTNTHRIEGKRHLRRPRRRKYINLMDVKEMRREDV